MPYLIILLPDRSCSVKRKVKKDAPWRKSANRPDILQFKILKEFLNYKKNIFLRSKIVTFSVREFVLFILLGVTGIEL